MKFRDYLLLLVLMIFALNWLASQPTNGQSKSPTTTVAVFDMRKAFQGHRRLQMALKALEETRELGEQELKDAEERIESMTERLQRLVTISDEYRLLKLEIEMAERSLNLSRNKQAEELASKSARLEIAAFREIYEEIQKIAEANGIGLVLNFDSRPLEEAMLQDSFSLLSHRVVYQQHLDLTPIVMHRLSR